MRPPSRAAHPTPCTPHPQRRDADTCVTVEEGEPPFCGGSAVTQHGHDAPSAAPPRQRPLGSASARLVLLCLLGARLVAPGGAALPG